MVHNFLLYLNDIHPLLDAAFVVYATVVLILFLFGLFALEHMRTFEDFLTGVFVMLFWLPILLIVIARKTPAVLRRIWKMTGE